MSLVNKILFGGFCVSGLGLAGAIAGCVYHQERTSEYHKDIEAISVALQQVRDSQFDLESRYREEFKSHGYNDSTVWLCNDVKRLGYLNENGLKFCSEHEKLKPAWEQVNQQYWLQINNLEKRRDGLITDLRTVIGLAQEYGEGNNMGLYGLGFSLLMVMFGSGLTRRKKEDEEKKPEREKKDLEDGQ